MTFEEMARANGWTVTLNHNDEYVAHDDTSDEANPDYYLDADNEEEAWEELCKLEGIDEEGFGHAQRQRADGTWETV